MTGPPDATVAAVAALLEQGLAHHRAGRLSEAEAAYRRVLEAPPGRPDALQLLGVLAYQAGRHDAAVALIREAITDKPAVAMFHDNLGNALRAGGKLDEAVAAYRRAIEIKADYPGAWNNLGTTLKDQGKLDDAMAAHRRAIDLDPGYAEAHYNLGNVLEQADKSTDAVTAYRRALDLKPDYVDAYLAMGVALGAQGKLEQSIAAYRRALDIEPDSPEAHNNLATALYGQRNLDEAAKACRRALDLKPDDATAHTNLGHILREQGKLDAAIAAHRRALEIDPDLADAHLNLGICLLLVGELTAGWREYGWRWQTKGFAPHAFAQPEWDGLPFSGKTILLHAEQGLGDTIQFIRYAPLVRALGGRVAVECPERLERLLRTADGVDELVAPGTPPPDSGLHAPLLSLPRILGTTAETIPAAVPYLSAEPVLVEAWRARIGRKPGFRVGVVWQGNTQRRANRTQAIALECLEPLAMIEGVHLFALQKGAGRDQLADLDDDGWIEDLGPELDNGPDGFVDTAAVVTSLDLLISVDTAAAHLAGALGRTVWTLLAFVPDWRWAMDRADSPWYPTMRLFRQPAPGDWNSVIDDVVDALKQLQRDSR